MWFKSNTMSNSISEYIVHNETTGEDNLSKFSDLDLFSEAELLNILSEIKETNGWSDGDLITAEPFDETRCTIHLTGNVIFKSYPHPELYGIEAF